MGRYQAYPEYKDSGVEWLRKIPAHWEVISLKYCIEKVIDNRGRTPPTTDFGIPLLEAKQMGGESIYSQNNFDKYISEEAYADFIRDDVKENDILFVTVGTVGKTNLVPKNSEYVIAQNIVGLRVRSYMTPLYFLFYLRSNEIKAEMSATNKDSILDSIKISDFIQSNICIPDRIEQQKIANFLDHETAKIDTLIEKQQQLIQLLKEKRQAVISHAVTKGLNPNAPMKDSGVEWLGEVPEHWEVLTTKRFFKLVADPAPDNNDMELLSVYTDIGVRPRKDLEAKGNKASTTDGYWLVKKDDLIVNKLLAWMGAVGYSAYDGVTSPAYDILRKTRKLNTKFFHYLFRTKLTQSEFKRWSRGIMEMRLRLYFEELGRIGMPFPPDAEQDLIVEEIERMEFKYDHLIETAESQIALSQERRTALISAAVTGKIDVRHFFSDDGQAPQN